MLRHRVNSRTPSQGAVLWLEMELCATAAEPVFTEVHGWQCQVMCSRIFAFGESLLSSPSSLGFLPCSPWSYCRILCFSWVQLRPCYSPARFLLCCFIHGYTSELISALQPTGVECKGNGEWVADSPRQRHRTDRRMHFHTQRRIDHRFPKLWGEWETEGDLLGSSSGLLTEEGVALRSFLLQALELRRGCLLGQNTIAKGAQCLPCICPFVQV